MNAKQLTTPSHFHPRQTLLNKDAIAINQDYASAAGKMIGYSTDVSLQ
jgi:hypothetical protein